MEEGNAIQSDLARRTLVEVCQTLDDRRLVAGTDGNISLRTGENTLLITPSGINKGRIREADLLHIDFEGRMYEGQGRVSKEWMMHVQVYRDAPRTGGVVHTHPPNATAFAAARRPIPEDRLIETRTVLGRIALAAYAPPGSADLAQSIAGLAADHGAILLANHGVITWGESLWDAYNRMDALENACATLIAARMLGGAMSIPWD